MNLVLTEKIQKAVKTALKNPEFPLRYKEEATEISKLKLESKQKYPISQDLVEKVSQISNVHFHELIKHSGLYFEPKPVKEKNPEFEAYLDKLRKEQQEREYNRMVSDVISSDDQKFNLGIKPSELRQVKSHLATIFNILFSMVAVYVAVYKVSKSIVSDIGLQVLMSLGGAFFIGVVEVILYVKYAYASTAEKKPSKNHKIATL